MPNSDALIPSTIDCSNSLLHVLDANFLVSLTQNWKGPAYLLFNYLAGALGQSEKEG